MGLMRFLLAMIVVLFHFGSEDFAFLDSHVAVKCFFIISGFYMAMILDLKYGSGAAGLRAFALNRFLRLYPLYFVILISTIGWYLARIVIIGSRTPLAPIFALYGQLPNWEIIGLWLSNVSLIGLDFVAMWDWVPGNGHYFLRPDVHLSQPTVITFTSTIWVVQAWSISMELLFYISAPFLTRANATVLAFALLASFGLDLWISLGLGLNQACKF